jgi:hypothetical protein
MSELSLSTSSPNSSPKLRTNLLTIGRYYNSYKDMNYLVRKLLDISESLGDAADELLEEELFEFGVLVDRVLRAPLDHPVDVVCKLIQQFFWEKVVV